MKPQLENGYFKIATELAEQFAKLHLSGNEWCVFWVVLRKTYGFHKKEDAISLTQFQTLTGLSRPSVSEAILKLVSKKVLVPKKVLYINIYSFNKDYSEWTSTQKGTSRVFPTRVVPKKVLKLVPKKVHTKDNKDIYTKDNTIVDVTTVTNNLNHLINLFKGVNPNYELLFSNKTERRALQRQVDKFSYKRIENLLNQLPEIVARPYSPRITRPSELEKKMGQLIIFLNQGKNDRRKVVDARGI